MFFQSPAQGASGQWRKRPYFQAFSHSGSPSDGKIQKQNAKKNFTARFTVKTIRLGAIDADTRQKMIFEISVSYAREPIDGDSSRRPNPRPLNNLLALELIVRSRVL